MEYFLPSNNTQMDLNDNQLNDTDLNLTNNNVPAVDWAVVVSRMVICFVGILGNMAAMFVIVVLKEYKKAVTHWYVLQLAIADSIFLLTLPFKMVEDIRHEWIYSSGMCKAKETILFLNYYASILFLMIMSIDRYVAVCHGFSDFLQKFRTHRAAYVITAVTWIIALILCTPVMLYSDKIGNVHDGCACTQDFPKDGISFDPTELKCKNLTQAFAFNYLDMSGSSANDSTDYIYGDYSEDENFVMTSDISTSPPAETTCNYNDQGNLWKGFLIFNFICMFVLPIMVMVFCYTKIIMKLHSMKAKPMLDSEASRPINSKPKRKSRSKSASTRKQDADRNRVTFTCAAMVSLFFACWFPFHVLHIGKVHGITGSKNMSKVCGILFLTGGLLAYMNSAINPYIYNFLGTKFFNRFRHASNAVNHKIRSSVSYSVARRRTSKSKISERTTSQSVSTSNSHTGVTKIVTTTNV